MIYHCDHCKKPAKCIRYDNGQWVCDKCYFTPDKNSRIIPNHGHIKTKTSS